MSTVRKNLERLAKMGDEEWKTPGHPMNRWIDKETVQRLAREALACLDEGTPCQ